MPAEANPPNTVPNTPLKTSNGLAGEETTRTE